MHFIWSNKNRFSGKDWEISRAHAACGRRKREMQLSAEEFREDLNVEWENALEPLGNKQSGKKCRGKIDLNPWNWSDLVITLPWRRNICYTSISMRFWFDDRMRKRYVQTLGQTFDCLGQTQANSARWTRALLKPWLSQWTATFDAFCQWLSDWETAVIFRMPAALWPSVLKLKCWLPSPFLIRGWDVGFNKKWEEKPGQMLAVILSAYAKLQLFQT